LTLPGHKTKSTNYTNSEILRGGSSPTSTSNENRNQENKFVYTETQDPVWSKNSEGQFKLDRQIGRLGSGLLNTQKAKEKENDSSLTSISTTENIDETRGPGKVKGILVVGSKDNKVSECTVEFVACVRRSNKQQSVRCQAEFAACNCSQFSDCKHN